ncbi:MAG TPA: PQQ-binding-like beta-propeller repeat protein [Polyangiaceae bacterium]
MLALGPARFSAFLAALSVSGLAAGSALASKTGPRPLWTFHAGAPLSGPPGVGADGSLAVGTLDGYVHALGADGVFRFSYTVAGRVAGSPVVLADGLVLAAATSHRLYAIRPDGSLAWTAVIGGGAVGPLVRDADERVWVRTGSGAAVAYSRRGGVVGFAKLARTMTVGPAAMGRGGVLVGSPGGELGLIGDYGKFRRGALPGPLKNVWAHEAGFLALGAGTLRELDLTLGVVWSLDGVDEVFCTSPVVVRTGSDIRWLSDSGGVSSRVPAPFQLARPSACAASSLFAVDARGAVVHLRSSGDYVRFEDAGGALVGLVPSRPGSLVAAYQDGRVVALKAAF